MWLDSRSVSICSFSMGCCSMLLNSFPSLCVLLLIIANRDTSLWFNIWQINFQFSYCFSLHELKAIGPTYHLVHYNCYPLIDYPIFYQVKIVIIDSVAFHFRQGFEDLALRTRILGEMALKLVKLAKMCNLAVTNICSLYCRFLSVPSSPSESQIWYANTSWQSWEKFLELCWYQYILSMLTTYLISMMLHVSFRKRIMMPFMQLSCDRTLS